MRFICLFSSFSSSSQPEIIMAADNPPFYSQDYKKPVIYLPKNVLNQNFSIPEPFVFYISKNAKSMVYEKIIKCCKYFSRNQSFTSAENLFNYECLSYEKRYDFSDKSIKIWVIGNLFHVYSPNAFTYILPKLWFINVENLSLFNQKISYNEFIFLVSAGNVQEFIFYYSPIKYSKNGKFVEVGDILEKLPLQLRKFGYVINNVQVSSVFTSESSKKMALLPPFPFLKDFTIGVDAPINFFSQNFQNFKNRNPSLDLIKYVSYL